MMYIGFMVLMLVIFYSGIVCGRGEKEEIYYQAFCEGFNSAQEMRGK